MVLDSICIEIRILARTSTGLCWPTYPLTSYFLLPLASILDRTKKNGNDVLHTQKERAACIQKSVVRFQKRIGFCLRSLRTMECRKQKAKCAFVCMFNAQINCNTCPFRNNGTGRSKYWCNGNKQWMRIALGFCRKKKEEKKCAKSVYVWEYFASITNWNSVSVNALCILTFLWALEWKRQKEPLVQHRSRYSYDIKRGTMCYIKMG